MDSTTDSDPDTPIPGSESFSMKLIVTVVDPYDQRDDDVEIATPLSYSDAREEPLGSAGSAGLSGSLGPLGSLGSGTSGSGPLGSMRSVEGVSEDGMRDSASSPGKINLGAGVLILPIILTLTLTLTLTLIVTLILSLILSLILFLIITLILTLAFILTKLYV